MQNTNKAIISVRNLKLFYGEKQLLHDINMDLFANNVTALIGPSGCGKSSFLRCLNRMNDSVNQCRIEGSVMMDGKDIYSRHVDVVELRTKVGMVFQKPNPLPKSIYENIAYAPRLHKIAKNRTQLDEIVERSLKLAGLFDEVKDRLNSLGTSLSGGQQQRLCIARAIAISPQIILMDEPCSALDPIATAKVESLIEKLKQDFTIIIVTHSMQQAARISNYTGFFHMGNLIEYDLTENIFTNPKSKQTEDYITGRFG